MCGIAGALRPDPAVARAAVERMCTQMIPRGPDAGGVEVLAAPPGALALGSRRLAIIDLSPAGNQPMSDPERGTTIVYNGMVYNFAELRAELEAAGERFVSHCDTEVILRAYGRFGRDCVRRLRGMFAFAIWDARSGELLLARDRLGIKPLYYAEGPDGLVFASQLKALLASGLVEARIDPAAVASYLSFGSVAEPLSAIAGVRSLPAGHLAVLRDGGLQLERYWRLPEESGAAPSREEAVRELAERLRETVRSHLVSDAPLGLFLSGGLDSTALAALAAGEGGDVRTVSVAFDEASFDEAPWAKLVADHVGARHTEVRLRPGDLLGALDGAFVAMDQPSFDGLNTYVVSKAAADSGLKVAVSGLGGDELFDGYGYRRRVQRLELARRLPAGLTRPAARAVAGRNEKAAAWLAGELPRGGSYELLRRVFLPAAVERLVPGYTPNGGPRPPVIRPGRDLFREVSTADLGWYTRDTLLRDSDAMSMASSLEVRVPFLDHPLVEWVVGLPESTKAGGHKALLVEAVGGLLPPAILDRPKQGFHLPFSVWIGNELAGEIEARLADPPALLDGILDREATTRIWNGYRQGRSRWTPVWALYSLCRWTEGISR